MDLKTYLRGVPPDEREAFAQRCGTTLNYLKQVAYGGKVPSAELCIGIARESGGAVPCGSLRRDIDWGWAVEPARAA